MMIEAGSGDGEKDPLVAPTASGRMTFPSFKAFRLSAANIMAPNKTQTAMTAGAAL